MWRFGTQVLQVTVSGSNIGSIVVPADTNPGYGSSNLFWLRSVAGSGMAVQMIYPTYVSGAMVPSSGTGSFNVTSSVVLPVGADDIAKQIPAGSQVLVQCNPTTSATGTFCLQRMFYSR